MLTLYQAEWCPYCHRVRQVLTELGLTYTCVNVPVQRADRTQVRELSGQDVVPVLKDGRKVLVGSDEIVAHLRAGYPCAGRRRSSRRSRPLPRGARARRRA